MGFKTGSGIHCAQGLGLQEITKGSGSIAWGKSHDCFQEKKKKIFAPPFPYEAAGFSKAYTVSTVFLGCRLFKKFL